jgi:Protein of unknown function (DUF2690)
MFHVRHRLTTIACVTFFGLGMTLSCASPTYAAGCFGSGCTGKDPQVNCSGARIDTLESRTGPGVGPSEYTIQLRYSPTCQAFWARGIRDDCVTLQTPWVHIAEEQQKSILLDGERTWVTSRVQRSHVHDCQGGTGWTPMNPDENDRHRACMATNFSDTPPSSPPFDSWFCTAWRY